ncbi:hypothetical protein [Dactylosporangium sp. CA-233914]|uniref:hypothetical protein n=1 Tax=Dactylosporangium sp. CA-233914 TaxID=3239934 RepID=UPI003D8D15ED
MRTRIALSIVVVVTVLAIVGVGYVAVLGVTVAPTRSRLIGHWQSNGNGTTVDLNADGSFTVTAFDACVGKVYTAIDDPARTELNASDFPPQRLVDVMSGAGRWQIMSRMDGDVNGYDLGMNFTSPSSFRLEFALADMAWQFRPTRMGLSHGVDPEGDTGPSGCSFAPAN